MLSLHGSAELGHAETVGEPGQEVQVRAHSGAHEGEKRVDGQAVDCPELDGCLQEAQCDHGSWDVKDDRVTHVGDGDPAAESRGARGIPAQGSRESRNFLSTSSGQPHQLDDRGQHLVLRLPPTR